MAKKKEAGDSFVIYKSFFLAVNTLPDAASKWQVMDRVCRFGLNLITEEEAADPEGFSPHQMSILYAVLPVVSASVQRYISGIEHGYKGGRPPKESRILEVMKNGEQEEVAKQDDAV